MHEAPHVVLAASPPTLPLRCPDPPPVLADAPQEPGPRAAYRIARSPPRAPAPDAPRVVEGENGSEWATRGRPPVHPHAIIGGGDGERGDERQGGRGGELRWGSPDPFSGGVGAGAAGEPDSLENTPVKEKVARGACASKAEGDGAWLRAGSSVALGAAGAQASGRVGGEGGWDVGATVRRGGDGWDGDWQGVPLGGPPTREALVRGAGGRKGADASRPGKDIRHLRSSPELSDMFGGGDSPHDLPPAAAPSRLAPGAQRPRGAFGVPAADLFQPSEAERSLVARAGRASEAEWTWIEATARAERGHGAMGLAQGAGGAQRAPRAFASREEEGRAREPRTGQLGWVSGVLGSTGEAGVNPLAPMGSEADGFGAAAEGVPEGAGVALTGPSTIGKIRERCEQALGLELFVEVYMAMRASSDVSVPLPAEVLAKVGAARLPAVRDVRFLISCEDHVYR
jgi:hypothetical protein